ncbi:hypothetical protein N7499_003359 [Penicillium canescens]|uniref:Uncharacterized protein n=1 Tax=Penicillium canescens TaxID=5083 RepID=A0AAD6N7R9_PENCN|nr:uncharacterized protein N7446_012278 [Penicillium canescens]XP_058367114.1 uncharacterized protein N7446_012086 [Penicillium canescens]KAJ5991647.1 hypothetical protein N7522_011854 [Penicillium canescens]KAJ6020065.1 hypothetical protein N7522_000140 [Penicillium canescens]KAJ6038000.1 hypothetical protein N7460_007771 [Penicillium canescens]KAJ6038628.1 hypothetical protein N7460_007345 [Penicillium canescens]KAJ6045414.1 hypothetical protein N7446_012278 [Penicillium canescens]
MFRSALRPLSFLHCTRRAFTARYFHRVTTDFVTHDARGNLVSSKVPIIIGNPGEAYVLIEQVVGSALRAASPYISASAASAEERCKLTFFHDSQYFGFGSSSYPRLYVPNQIPRQTESDSSPATLFLGGKMHEIALDGTPDANFAENASATGRNLDSVLYQLRDM